MAVDDVVGKKLEAVDALESQFFEGGCLGSADLVPTDPAGRAARRAAVRAEFDARFAATATRFRAELVARYGPARSEAVKYAEAFEICEYGQRPDAAEIARLFPF